MIRLTKSIVQTLQHPDLERAGVRLLVKRDDLLHTQVSGNKWRKLKFNLEAAKTQGHHTILTYGGAYSNHLAATATAGKMAGFKTIGIVRGERTDPLNGTLQLAQENGMRLEFVDRDFYRKKEEPAAVRELEGRLGTSAFYRIPEGGANELAVVGCKEILMEIGESWDVVACACGTGTTLAGLIRALPTGKRAIGFPVLKGGAGLRSEIRQWLKDEETDRWELDASWHFGGYARFTEELVDFVRTFHKHHDVALDLIYTGKLFYGLIARIRRGDFARGTTILAIHTGGLQGNQGFKERFGLDLPG